MWSTTLPIQFNASSRPTQLFVNAQRRPRARMPNVVLPASMEALYADNATFHWRAPLTPCPVWGPCPANNSAGFIYNNITSPQLDAASTWPDLQDAWLLSFAAWTAHWRQIASIDNITQVVALAAPVSFPFGMFGGQGSISGGRFLIENVRAALDAPGEWWADVYGKKLFYIPLPGETMGAVDMVLPFAPTLISIAGASPTSPVQHVSFVDLALQYTGELFASRGSGSAPTSAIYMNNVANTTLSNLTIANGGGGGVQLLHGVASVVLDRLWLHDLSGGGVVMARWPADALDVTISNCLVHTVGHTYLYAPCGISPAGSRNITVTHNEVFDTPWAGMCAGGQTGKPWPAVGSPDATAPPRIVFSHNHIHHYGQGVLSDFGGVYVYPTADCFLPSGSPPQTGCFTRLLMTHNLIEDGRHYGTGCEFMQTRMWCSPVADSRLAVQLSEPCARRTGGA
jgi:hypothetical protein